MKAVFLSFRFKDDADRGLVSWIEKLLQSHDLAAVTGEHLGGDALTPAVMARIEQSDGLIALLTRREQLANSNKWTTHPWVSAELNHARSKQKRAIALIEEDVETGGAYAEHERIHLNRDNPLQAFLALSSTIAQWKRDAGRTVKIRIMPSSLAKKIGFSSGGMKCCYRFWSDGQPSDWREALQVPEPGGTFIYARIPRDEDLIQLQIEGGPANWQSPAAPQLLEITLKQTGVA